MSPAEKTGAGNLKGIRHYWKPAIAIFNDARYSQPYIDFFRAE